MQPLPTYAIRVHRADPTLAELHIEFNDVSVDMEVQGRLMGPRCPGATTIEVAYPLQRQTGSRSRFKVVIPEPTYWSAEHPCVYSGPVEFRRRGALVGTIDVSIGIAPTTE